MPPYGYTLSKTEIEALIAYIRLISDPPVSCVRNGLCTKVGLSGWASQAWFLVCSLGARASLAQVVSPAEIKDPALRSLQLQYIDDLRLTGQDILAIHFDYPFYLSRKLDLDQAQQLHADQRSVRFDNYNGRTVIAITGNYYAAYSADKINPDERARSTFLDVIIPVLKLQSRTFRATSMFKDMPLRFRITFWKSDGSLHGRPENLMVFLPQNAALRLLGSKDEDTRQAALMQGQTFLMLSLLLSGSTERDPNWLQMFPGCQFH